MLSSPAHADEVYTVCIGDRNTCQGSPWFLCGTSIDQAAQAVCTTPSVTKQEVSHYTVLKLQDQPGGRCGYAVFRVTCKKWKDDTSEFAAAGTLGGPPPSCSTEKSWLHFRPPPARMAPRDESVV